MKSFTPEDAKGAALSSIPAEMIEAVNQLLAENYNKTRIVLKISKVKERFRKLKNCTDLVIEPLWLDFEPIFRANGWTVIDRPGYNETYEGYYEFKPKNSND